MSSKIDQALGTNITWSSIILHLLFTIYQSLTPFIILITPKIFLSNSLYILCRLDCNLQSIRSKYSWLFFSVSLYRFTLLHIQFHVFNNCMKDLVHSCVRTLAHHVFKYHSWLGTCTHINRSKEYNKYFTIWMRVSWHKPMTIQLYAHMRIWFSITPMYNETWLYIGYSIFWKMKNRALNLIID